MKKALVVIIGIILIVVAMAVFFIEKMMLVDTSKYEYLSQPRITEMQNQKMIEIELTGPPSETAPKAMGQLFSVFYMLKNSGNTISKPLPKARWIGDFNNPETMVGKYAMQVSDNVTKLPDLKDSQVKLVTWEYGTVAEILHVGPYDQEEPTTKKLMKYIQDKGYWIIGEHEEEYLQGPDLLHIVKPKDYKTIIRYRVEKNSTDTALKKEFIIYPAKKMAELDGAHSEGQFRVILDNIKKYYPELRENDTAFNVTWYHEQVKKEHPQISLYDFCEGFLNFSPDIFKSLQESYGVKPEMTILKYLLDINRKLLSDAEIKEREYMLYIESFNYCIALYEDTLPLK